MATDPFITGARLGLRPPSDLKPWEWAAQNVKIANSERSSRYDPEQTPWWKRPMECAGDYSTREVVVVAPTGSGKSTMVEALVPYIVSEDPGPLLYASQTDSDAKFWAESRLKPAMLSCPTLRNLWPKDRHASRKMEIIFPHMPMVICGANHSSFQEKSVRWLFGDEVWDWEPGLVREFKARHHNRWNRKVILVSQGSTAGGFDENGACVGGDEFWQEWRKSDMGVYSWKCQECGDAQPYDFTSLKYDVIENGMGGIDEQATSKTARMACRGCGHEYADKPEVRRKLCKSNTDNGNGGYISTNAAAVDNVKGFRIDSLAIWWVPWEAEILEFLEAKRQLKAGVTDKMRQFTQKRRADFWSDSMSTSKVDVVRSADFSKIDHEDGAPLDDEMARFATIDAGGDHYWMTICAWKAGGCVRVLWEGYIPSDGGDETQLLGICDRYNVKRRATFIDIGYEQDRILDLCVKHGWTGIKGSGNHRAFPHPTATGKPVEKLYSTIRRAKAKSGGIANFILIASNEIKDILSRVASNPDQLQLPADLSKPFESHMKCEQRQVEKHPKTGQEKVFWIRPNNRANHLWDCMCYQVAAALMVGVFSES